MKTCICFLLTAAICAILPSCADHDDPELEPIDTSQVKITASVTDLPNSTWMNVTEEMTIRVADVEMSAPKGVVLRSISLIANNGMSKYLIDEKPYSGEPLEFRVPLNGKQGRLNISVRGNLIKKDSRDAEIIIADNIQRIVFSESPKFECRGWLYASVKSKSTTGEEYSKSFELTSSDGFTIEVPRSELYWTPASGTASTVEVTMSGGATSWSPNTTFECEITRVALGHSSADKPTLTMTIPNTPGSLDQQRLQLYILTTYFGIWENITIEPYNLTNVFGIIETE